MIEQTDSEVLLLFNLPIKKSLQSIFPFFNLPILPALKQEWGSMKYFSLEKGPVDEKVWRSLLQIIRKQCMIVGLECLQFVDADGLQFLVLLCLLGLCHAQKICGWEQ